MKKGCTVHGPNEPAFSDTDNLSESAMESHNAIIFRIKKFAIHDGPGIRTTVFMKGCPLSCWWCHNPEGLLAGQGRTASAESDLSGNDPSSRLISESMLMKEIEKDLIFYDDSSGGVTFSGGEPLMQSTFLLSVIEKCREKGIHTALDTSGYSTPEVFQSLAEKADLILFDLKLMDPSQHLLYTGRDNSPIIENLSLLKALRKCYRIRIPLIPGITDTPSNIEKIGLHLKDHPNVEGVDLLPYHRLSLGKYQRLGLPNRLEHLVPLTESSVQLVRRQLEAFGLNVFIGG